MVSTVGGLNPQPLSHESSALTIRPRLLAKTNQALSFVVFGLFLVSVQTARDV
jgi:hypothetical protein